MKCPAIVLLVSLLAVACSSPQKKANDAAPAKLESNQLDISLAQWSLHEQFFGGELNHLDFARVAADSFDIYALEYVSQFFQDKAQNIVYLQQMKDSCQKYNVKSVMIMVDHEGELGDTVEVARQQAVHNHIKWIKAAAFLGCTAIRVNANGLGDYAVVHDGIVQSLTALSDSARKFNINIVVENHGIKMPDG